MIIAIIIKPLFYIHTQKPPKYTRRVTTSDGVVVVVAILEIFLAHLSSFLVYLLLLLLHIQSTATITKSKTIHHHHRYHHLRVVATAVLLPGTTRHGSFGLDFSTSSSLHCSGSHTLTGKHGRFLSVLSSVQCWLARKNMKRNFLLSGDSPYKKCNLL